MKPSAADVTGLNAAVTEYTGIYETAAGSNASKADTLLKNEKKRRSKRRYKTSNGGTSTQTER
jgi:hypothetical protein